MLIFRPIVLISASIICAISLSACRPHGADLRKKTLISAHESDPKSLDPAVAYDAISWDIIGNVHETLYQYHYLRDQYEIEPLLAKDMPWISKDKKTVRIKIRNGIYFHDNSAFPQNRGRELTAEDFIYAWKRIADPKTQSPGWWIFDRKIIGINGFRDSLKKSKSKDLRDFQFKQTIKGLKAKSRYELEIQLYNPYPQLLHILTLPFTAPVPFEAVNHYGDDNGQVHHVAVGTGPYQVSDWSRGSYLELKKNPNYHHDFYPSEADKKFFKAGFTNDSSLLVPFIERVRFEFIKESQPMWLKFLKGNLDFSAIPKDYYDETILNGQLRDKYKKMGLRLWTEPSLTYFYIGFNMRDKLVGKNKLLRQALSSAINREKFLELFTNDRGTKMDSMLPPGIPGRPLGARLKYDFNLKKAKDLLKAAGFPDGNGLPVLILDMRSSSTMSRQMGEFFTQQFKQIGVKLRVQYNPFTSFLEKIRNGNFQIEMGGWTMDYPDAQNSLQLLFSKNSAPGPNEVSYYNATFDQLYLKMAEMEPSASRNEIIARMEALVQEDVPWAYLFYRSNLYLYYDHLENFRRNDIFLNSYKYFKLAHD